MVAVNVITGEEAAKVLKRYGFSDTRIIRILDIAREFTNKNEPCPGGFVGVRFRGNVSGHPGQYLYEIEDHTGKPAEKVAPATGKRYTQGDENESDSSQDKTPTQRRRNTMPPRSKSRTQTAPAPEPEAVNGDAPDLSAYLTKDYTATQGDFLDWFEQEVAKLDNITSERALVLGAVLYGHFQRSDFNHQRKEARRAERAAPAPAPAPASDESTPAAPARPARRTAPAAAPAKPAAPARGRGSKAGAPY